MRTLILPMRKVCTFIFPIMKERTLILLIMKVRNLIQRFKTHTFLAIKVNSY